MNKIDKSIIKRNYLYIIYNILKDKTSNTNHLSIKAICDYIYKKYDLKVDKNTVGRVIDDLTIFGYDVKKDSTGYFLDKRVFTDGEMGLLIDGIESISVLSSDSKLDIYEKICKINGKKPESIDCYLYTQDEFYIDEELLSRVELVYAAIGDNKKLNIYYLYGFITTILDELTTEEIDYISEKYDLLMYEINPYQVFRSKQNKLFLLYYFKLPSRFVIGALSLSTIDLSLYIMKDKNRDDIDVSLLLSKDLTDFTAPRDYSKGEQILTAVIIPGFEGAEKTMNFKFILDSCESHETFEEDGYLKYKINYKCKNENNIIELCLEVDQYVKVLPGSRLYDNLKAMLNSLKHIISK